MRIPPAPYCALGIILGFVQPKPLSAAATQENAWQEVLRLDEGPKEPAPASGANPSGVKVKERFVVHLEAQEKALRAFLDFSPQGDRLFEAKFRLARVLALRGEIENNPALQKQAAELLSALDSTATPEQKAHIAFTRITLTMRIQRFPTKEQRDNLLANTRAFHDHFPSDPRTAQLLTEVATRFDGSPTVKTSILEEALQLTKDPQLSLRIKDDLKRTSLLGKQIRFSIGKTGGGRLLIETLQGNPVVLLYFSEESIPSLVAWESINEGLREHPNVKRVAVSLDKKIANLAMLAKEYGSQWTICWDGQGWNSPIAREYGINAVPTAWLIDAQGRLQSLNILENLPNQLLDLEKKR
jgi:hypothetical protein